MRRSVVIVAVLLAGLAAWAQSPASDAADMRVVPVTEEHHHHLYLENQYVRVFKVEVGPHDATLIHHHPYDYCYVVLGDSKIRNAVVGKPPVTVEVADGTVSYSKGDFSHRAINLSDKPFRNVTIDFPPRPGHTPAQLPALEFSSGTGTILFFDNEHARGYEVTIEPGATLENHPQPTPSLIVAIDDYDLRKAVAGQQPTEVHAQTENVTWNEAGAPVSLTNIGRSEARFLVVEMK